MLFNGKLTGTTSEIDGASLGQLKHWVTLVSPSATNMIDWEKVETGAKVVTKLSATNSIVIESDNPPKVEPKKVPTKTDGEQSKTTDEK